LPIVRTYRFSDITSMDIEVGFPEELIALYLMAAFIFAVPGYSYYFICSVRSPSALLCCSTRLPDDPSDQ
jgi:hypothetical protein